MKLKLNCVRLRMRRAEIKATMAQICEKANVGYATLSAMENDEGYNPTLDTIGKVADAVGLHYTELILEEEEGG